MYSANCPKCKCKLNPGQAESRPFIFVKTRILESNEWRSGEPSPDEDVVMWLPRCLLGLMLPLDAERERESGTGLKSLGNVYWPASKSATLGLTRAQPFGRPAEQKSHSSLQNGELGRHPERRGDLSAINGIHYK